jgi:hypothetical protein
MLPAADFIRLLSVAQGSDPERKDRRVVAEGKVASVGLTPEGWLRLEFVGAAPRRTVLAHVNIADKDLLKALQQKLGSKTDPLDVEGKTIVVRGLVTMQTGSPCILITSADQMESVPPGKERFPVAPGPGNRPGTRRPPGRN